MKAFWNYSAGLLNRYEFKAEWCFVIGLLLLTYIGQGIAWGESMPLWKASALLVLPGFFFIMSDLLSVSNFSFYEKWGRTFARKGILAIQYILLMFVLAGTFGHLTYLVCALGANIADDAFMQMDKVLGFDWLAGFYWSQETVFKRALAFCYGSLIPQAFLMALWFSFREEKRQLHEILWIFIVSMILTLLVFAAFPAYGPVHVFGLEETFAKIQPSFAKGLQDMQAIHAGMSVRLDVKSMTGIVAFPSFHTVSALVFVYAFRKQKVLLPLVAGVNALLLMATPFWGNHYLVDMMAGAVIAVISVVCGRYFSARRDYSLKPAY